MPDSLINVSYPARLEDFHGAAVTLYELGGLDFLTAEDLGACLGLAEPRKSVINIFNRHREELEPHTCVTKLMTQGQNRDTRLFDETGCHLLALFAKTKKAKSFRLWLARLPKKVRQAREVLPAVLEADRLQGRQEGAALALSLLEHPAAAKLGLDGLSQLLWFRTRGLTQEETGELLGFSLFQIKEVEKALKPLGLTFAPVIGSKRRRQMRLSLAQALSSTPHPVAQASPPALL